MSKKYYAVYPDQIKIDNEVFFGIDYKITNFINELIEQYKKQKEVIDKTINAIDLVIELIKQQPTEDDRWILNRLNGFKIILEDKVVSDEINNLKEKKEK